MAESLGGTTRRSAPLSATGTRGSFKPEGTGASRGANADAMGGSQKRNASRPASGIGMGSRTTPVTGGELAGSKKGVMTISEANTTMARRRVEEKRRMKEKGLWGSPVEQQGRINKVKPVKPDLPAFWSVREHGQPWSDERLAKEAFEQWQVQPDHKGVRQGNAPLVEEARKALRKSLETGTLCVDRETLEPVDKSRMRALAQDEREYLISKMKPHEKLFALRANQDRDCTAEDFQPWTRNIDKDYDREPWYRNMDICIKMALTKLEYIMREHLKYLSNKDYEAYRAPTMPPKHIMQRAFKKVDPGGSGYVSIEQFGQLWQNVLNLMDHKEETKLVNGKKKKVLVPIGRRFIDRNTCAAIFCKYGFNKAGLMPYSVFIQSMAEKNSRLLGHELLLDTKTFGKNGLNSTQDIGMVLSGAKIMYTNCKMGVYAPPDFEEDTAFRSAKPPRATMWLEHVYGYAGLKNLANNLFYTHRGEIAYYVGMIGIVWSKDIHDTGKPSQRFFYGHNNDITCMTIHPNRRFAATGQQTHDDGTPYVCIWDVDTMCQVQRLVHPDDTRSVVAVAFSSWAGSTGNRGGEIMATVTSDDRHTVRLWRWLTKEKGGRLVDVTDPAEQLMKAIYLPGWSFGPAKKIGNMELEAEEGQLYFHSSEQTADGSGKGAERPSPCPPFDNDDPTKKKSYLDIIYSGKKPTNVSKSSTLRKSKKAAEHDGDEAVQDFACWAVDNGWPDVDAAGPPGQEPQGWGSKLGFPADPMKHFLVRDILERPGWTTKNAKGFEYIELPETAESDKPKDEVYVAGYCPKDKSWELIASFPGYQGTPPQVYGVEFNPFRNSNGKPGCEFLQYGIHHLKVYMKDDDKPDGSEGNWVGTSCSFGSDKVDNVFSACFVPAMHTGRSKTEVCIVAGFPSGRIGLLIPPFPTRPGSTYTLSKVFDAHHPGRVMTAATDPRALPGHDCYSGVRVLKLRKGSGGYQVLSGGADGCITVWGLQAPTGTNKDGAPRRGAVLTDPVVYKLDDTLEDPTKADRVVGMDAYPQPNEERFPELRLKSGEEFVVGTDGCDIWEVDDTPRLLIEGNVGDVYTVAPHPRDPHIFATACESDEIMVWDAHIRQNILKGHLGFKCRSVSYSQETIMSSDSSEGFHLAVGGKMGHVAILDAEDLRPVVILHDSKQAVDALKFSPAGGPGFLAAGSHDLCVYIYNAHKNYQFVSKCVGHSGTIEHLDWSLPIEEPRKYDGKHILRSTCTNSEILYWYPQTGKAITENQRKATWDTWCCKYGFDVMGIWEDGCDRTDINAVDRSRRGAALYDANQGLVLQKTDPEAAEWTQGGGYLVTAEDTSQIKIFNYPVVQDDAPYRCFRGHASHVMCIRFLSDDRRVISVGAGDRAVMQWRTLGVNQYDTEYDWCVMECIDAALAKLADKKSSKIPKPGGSNWKPLQSSTGDSRSASKAYGVRDDTVRTLFGGTEASPYHDRSEFYKGFVEGMHLHGGDRPSVLCSLCHGEAPAEALRLKHRDAMYVCMCPHGIHRCLNVCSHCGPGIEDGGGEVSLVNTSKHAPNDDTFVSTGKELPIPTMDDESESEVEEAGGQYIGKGALNDSHVSGADSIDEDVKSQSGRSQTGQGVMESAARSRPASAGSSKRGSAEPTRPSSNLGHSPSRRPSSSGGRSAAPSVHEDAPPSTGVPTAAVASSQPPSHGNSRRTTGTGEPTPPSGNLGRSASRTSSAGGHSAAPSTHDDAPPAGDTPAGASSQLPLPGNSRRSSAAGEPARQSSRAPSRPSSAGGRSVAPSVHEDAPPSGEKPAGASSQLPSPGNSRRSTATGEPARQSSRAPSRPSSAGGRSAAPSVHEDAPPSGDKPAPPAGASSQPSSPGDSRRSTATGEPARPSSHLGRPPSRPSSASGSQPPPSTATAAPTPQEAPGSDLGPGSRHLSPAGSRRTTATGEPMLEESVLSNVSGNGAVDALPKELPAAEASGSNTADLMSGDLPEVTQDISGEMADESLDKF